MNLISSRSIIRKLLLKLIKRYRKLRRAQKTAEKSRNKLLQKDKIIKSINLSLTLIVIFEALRNDRRKHDVISHYMEALQKWQCQRSIFQIKGVSPPATTLNLLQED